MRFSFKCPKCGRKTLSDIHEKATIRRKVLELDFMDNNYLNVSQADPSTYFRVYGSEDIIGGKQSFGCHNQDCDFRLPVRNTAELIEWLLFHKMVTLRPYDEDKWPFSRAKFIEKGEISRELLVALHGPTYVPPDEATLIAQMNAKSAS